MKNEKQLHQDFGVRVADLRVIGPLSWVDGRGTPHSGTFDQYYIAENGRVYSCFKYGFDKRWRWRKLSV